jgi:poly(A) polymerase
VQFGVVLVIEEGLPFEVATFRRDGTYLDHRRPVEVHFADARSDALRRDFTINGLFLDPATDKVIDYVGGGDDLRRGVIRAIGDPRARFGEDRLRLLRGVRFAARLGFTIDPATFAATVELARTVTEIAWERIGDEIVKMLTEGAARRGFTLLDETGLLAVVLPEVAAMRGVEQSQEYHPEGDVLTHTLLCLEKLDATPRSEVLALGVLLHDVAKPACASRGEDGRITFYGHTDRGAEMAIEICNRLRRSRDTGDRVAWLVKNHLRHVQAPVMRVATLKRFLAEPLIDTLLELVRIDASSSSGDLSGYDFCRAKQQEIGAADTRPEPLLRGRDLLSLGHRPGPHFRDILERAYDAQLEGQIVSADQARAWAIEHFPPHPAADAR